MPPSSSGARSFFVVDGDTPLDSKHQRINREITAPQVRLVGLEGEQLGIVAIGDALAQAEAAEVDLVEIAPMAEPPVVRIMDYGKFKYRESKRAHEAKVKLKQIQVKEVKFRPGTDDGDYKIKLQEPHAVPAGRRQGQDHDAVPRPRDGAPGVRGAPARADPQRPRAVRAGRAVPAVGRPADGDAAGPEEGAGPEREARTARSRHHPNKPEAGPANPAPQASPEKKPESTAVGSK